MTYLVLCVRAHALRTSTRKTPIADGAEGARLSRSVPAADGTAHMARRALGIEAHRTEHCRPPWADQPHRPHRRSSTRRTPALCGGAQALGVQRPSLARLTRDSPYTPGPHAHGPHVPGPYSATVRTHHGPHVRNGPRRPHRSPPTLATRRTSRPYEQVTRASRPPVRISRPPGARPAALVGGGRPTPPPRRSRTSRHPPSPPAADPRCARTPYERSRAAVATR